MDTGVMQISGLTFKDQDRIDHVTHKVNRRWDDDMKRMKDEMKEYGQEDEG